MERERKFLVKKRPIKLSAYPHAIIEQGYLAVENGTSDAAEVRLRKTGGHWYLTVKVGKGLSRQEKEVRVPGSIAHRLWPLTKARRLRKTRYKIPYRRLKIELDVYHGKAKGLMVAEVEFASETASKAFQVPQWFGKEVTGRKMYSNAQLATIGWKHSSNSSL